jgi:hypothetical protein
MPMTDPTKRDEDAGRADLMAVYEKYGRTDAIARQRGGDTNATARLAELNRIDDVYSQCQMLDQDLPEWTEGSIFPLVFPKRGRAVN